MEVVGLLAPIAFVFAIAGLGQANAQRAEITRLKARVEALEAQLPPPDSTG